jgi:raffinose/stachyose/melibiose transport system permease protein
VRRKLRKDGRTALLFLAPLLAMYLVYFAYSFYFLIDTSFKKVSITFTDAAQVGWNNYRLLFEDPAFIRSILNNLLFAATTIIVSLTVAFFIAAALATGVRGRRLYYVIFLVPALMPVALVATIFNVMLEYRDGALNQTLRKLGLGSLAQHWLTQPQWAIAAVVTLFAYLIGLPIMYYTADLATIRTDAIEAAVIDGAGTFRILRSILHPMLRATHITIILALLLGSFRAFEIVLLSTGGGPSDNTEVVGTYIYGYVTSAGSTIGFASAASVVVLVVALLGSAVQMLLTRRSSK